MKSKKTQNLKEYEVEKVIDHREIKSVHHYLVKWKGYSDEENTWEPETNLTNCRDLIDEFWRLKSEPQCTIIGVRINHKDIEYYGIDKVNGLFTISPQNRQKYIQQIIEFWERKYKEASSCD